jgi:hypothetical protein
MLHESEARIIAAFSYYTELNHQALRRSYADLDVQARLDSIEARISLVEKRLNLPPAP